MKPATRQRLCAALSLAATLAAAHSSAQAQQTTPPAGPASPPGAAHICAEARANILRARLTYEQKPLQDKAHISKIFTDRARHNEYHVELRPRDEWRKQYPDLWMQGFYAIANESVLQEARIRHSVGDEISVHGTVTGIEFVPPPPDAPAQQRPACRIGVRIDWNQADKP